MRWLSLGAYCMFNMSPENMHNVVYVSTHINTNIWMLALLPWVYLESSLTKMQTYREDSYYIVHTDNCAQDQDLNQ